MRKIWNRPSLPIWSLVTHDGADIYNMNICTYVTSISMEPKQMLVALYHGTKTLENVEKNKAGLLQLLPESLATVVRTCGQESGHATDKIARLQKRFELQYYNGWPYFALAAGYLELDFVNLIETGGDHTLGVATVKTHKNLHDVPILTTDYLKLHKFTR